MMEIKVHVKPNASENEIISKGYVWKIAIAAPPEGGKANKELIKFLRKELKRPVEIVKGRAAKDKLVVVLP